MKTSKARLQGAHLGPVAHGAHGPVGTDVGPPGRVNRWVRWPNVATPRIIPIFTRNGWTFLDVSLFCYFWPCSFSTFTGGLPLRQSTQSARSEDDPPVPGIEDAEPSEGTAWGGPSSPSKTWLPALPVFLCLSSENLDFESLQVRTFDFQTLHSHTHTHIYYIFTHTHIYI